MNKKDYAIVAGIRRYPRFGRTVEEAADLQGPDNDATAIFEWLVDPARGGVPETQVRRIQSADFADPFANPALAQPTSDDLAQAFSWLDSIAAKNNRAGHGLTVGRRLYVYLAGHGFAPHLKQGAVFTAEATQAEAANFFASDWVDALYASQYFKEYVLWMDSCMSFLLAVTAVASSLRRVQATGPRPKLFTAFAARRPEEAIEKPMPDGRVHGIFTWTLLQALDGKVPFDGNAPGQGAIDITTARIKSYLITAMRKHLTAAELRDDRISREPDFGSDDPMVFGTVAPGGGFKVVLSFPGSAPGTPFTVLGDGLQQIASGQVAATPTELTLGVGMYAAVVDGTTKTFEVVGDTDVAVG